MDINNAEVHPYDVVEGMMKVGNILPREGIEPAPLAFRASMLTITPTRVPVVIMLASPAYAARCRRGQSR